MADAPAITTAPGVITLTINGQAVRVPKGTLVIDAAHEVGVMLPRYCSHPKLKPVANCRICLVEIEKSRTPAVASCCLEVTEGMVVRTNSPVAEAARSSVMEFLLANHPLDCPICDKGGECDLQDWAFEYSKKDSRYTEEKRVFTKQHYGPFIEFEMNRCVACMRCVRYCDEVLHVGALGAEGRGLMTKIVPFAGQSLDCEFCGGCIQICPVGALTNRLVQYNWRPWQTKKTWTTCTYCADGCQLQLDVMKDKVTNREQVVRVVSDLGKGKDFHDLCAKGFFGYHVVQHPDRLTQPLLRRNNALAPVTWDDALDEAADRLEAVLAAHGPGAVAGLITARCTNEDLYVFQRFMREVIGTNHLDSSARYGHVNAVHALHRVFGTIRPLVTLDDVRGADVILALGMDLTETNPITALAVKSAATRQGARLIVVDPLNPVNPPKSTLAALANPHLQIRADAYPAAMLGLVKAMLDVMDVRGLEQAPRYVAGLRAATAAVTPAELEQRTGIPDEPFKAAASALARAARPVILVGPGVVAAGSTVVMNVMDLFLLTGKADRPGCGVLPLAEENNEQGAAVIIQPGPGGATLLEILEGARQGRIKALYIVGENPLGTLPRALVDESLARLDLLICQDVFLTETARQAHIVFPAATFAEKDGTFTNLEGRVQHVRRALVDPVGESRPDWEIFSLLAEWMGRPMIYVDAGEILQEITRVVPGFADPTPPAWPTFEAAARRYLASGWEEDLASRYRFQTAPMNGRGHHLVVGPVLFHSGKFSTRSEALRMLCDTGRLGLGPADAERLGLQTGQHVRLTFADGSVQVAVEVQAKYPAGLVFFPEHFNDPSLKDHLTVTLDPVTKAIAFKHALVTVEKATAGP